MQLTWPNCTPCNTVLFLGPTEIGRFHFLDFFWNVARHSLDSCQCWSYIFLKLQALIICVQMYMYIQRKTLQMYTNVHAYRHIRTHTRRDTYICIRTLLNAHMIRTQIHHISGKTNIKYIALLRPCIWYICFSQSLASVVFGNA
jgi:hypothetical protein